MAFFANLLGAKPTAAQKLAAAGIQVQSSSYGRPYSLIFGKTRVAGTLVWYGDFGHNQVSVGHGGKGGPGGKGGGNQGVYYASIVLAICEGPISNIPNVWLNNPTNEALNLAGLGQIGGSLNQEPWTYLTSAHPDQALGYSGIALVVGNNINLGSDSNLPNYNFEVEGLEYGTSGNGQGDADPDLVVTDLITSPQYGVGFPENLVGSVVNNREYHAIPASPGPYTITVSNASSFLFNLSVVAAGGTLFTCAASNPAAGQYRFDPAAGIYTFNSADAGTAIHICYASLGGFTQYHDFCRASGLWISPAYDSQQAANTLLSDIATYTYSEFVWSSGVLTLVPRGAANLSANGATYTAPSQALFDLDDDDFL